MSEDWKQKYLASLDRHERAEKDWRAMEALLRQGLTRVALAAQGVDGLMDKDLDQLRQVIRSGGDFRRLEAAIEEVSQSVKRLDEQRASQQGATSPQALLTQWLDSLALPRELRGRAKALRRALDQAGDISQMEAPLRELAELVNSMLSHEPQAGGGLFKRLFGGNDSAADEKPTGKALAESAAPLLGDFCIQLLETLSLPLELTDKVEQLKDRLGEGLSDQSIAVALNAIADLISTMRLQMEAEKQELQDFLQQLTGRLQELDQNLAGAQNEHQASIHSGRQLDEVVQAQVRGIETTVEQVQDLPQLKGQIQERLDTIRLHFEEHRRSDVDRQERLEEELAKLNDRIRNMEAESENLRQRLKEKHELAMRDPLTGLNNRLAYDDRITQEHARWLRYHQPLVLLVVDIDRFKRINDGYGHKAGDKALKIIAERVANNLRECDFVARYGGEEFTAIMPETSLEDGLAAAEKLRTAVAASQFHYQGQEVPITVSIGLAGLRENDTPESLFQRADRALYQAKADGRNCVRSEDI